MTLVDVSFPASSVTVTDRIMLPLEAMVPLREKLPSAAAVVVMRVASSHSSASPAIATVAPGSVMPVTV